MKKMMMLAAMAMLAVNAQAITESWDCNWQTAASNVTSAEGKNWANPALGRTFALTMTVTFSAIAEKVAANAFLGAGPALLAFGAEKDGTKQQLNIAFNGWSTANDIVLTGDTRVSAGGDNTTTGTSTGGSPNWDVASTALATFENDKQYKLEVIQANGIISVYWNNDLVIETARALENEGTFVQWASDGNGENKLTDDNVGAFTIGTVQYATVLPEPTALALLALGVAGVALKRKMK